MDPSELTQILQAKKAFSREQFLAAELETLIRMLPGDNATKMKHAHTILKGLLNTKVNPNSKLQKILYKPAVKLGQSYSRPDTYPNTTSVSNVNDDAKTKVSPQSSHPDRQSCIMASVNAGLSISAAKKNCDQFFSPGPNTVGGITKRKAVGGLGHATSSSITTYYPTKSGFRRHPETIKQASIVDGVPYWMHSLCKFCK